MSAQSNLRVFLPESNSSVHTTPSASINSRLSTSEVRLAFEVTAEVRTILYPKYTRACELFGEKEIEEIRVFSSQTSSAIHTTPSISIKNEKIFDLSRSKSQMAFDVVPEIKAIPDGLHPKYTNDSEFCIENKVEEEASHVRMKIEYMSMAEKCKDMLAALRSSLEEQIECEEMEALGIEDGDTGAEYGEDDNNEEGGFEIPVFEIGDGEIVDVEDYFADTEDAYDDADGEDFGSETEPGELPSHDKLRNEYMSIAAEILADLAKMRASIQPAVEREVAAEVALEAFVDEDYFSGE